MKRFMLLALMAGLMAACASKGLEGQKGGNEPPTVWLAAAPPEGSTGRYTVQLFWGGWDPDGEIAHYEYLVTDNQTGIFSPSDTTGVPWKPVVGNDSTFTFSADRLVDTLTTNAVTDFARSHTFFIRAVDEEGRRSAEPAYRSFTSRTLSPSVRIDVPLKRALNPADVPPISTFRWTAFDYVVDQLSSQEPDSVQWAMVPTAGHSNSFLTTLAYLRTRAAAGEWQPWVYYKAPGDSGKFWTTPPQEFGNYIFAIRAKDEAGAVTPVLDEGSGTNPSNVRRVRVSRRTTGPLFTVSNLYMGTIKTSSCSTPITILDIPAGVPIDFTLEATAESYGGTVSGYRYGWDIPDLNDPEQWEIDFTPFVGSKAKTPPRFFFFGTHTLTTEVIDNSGFCSRIEVKVNIVQFTLDRNLLLIDDFKFDETSQAGFFNTVGRGSLPNDAEHDAFWNDMLSNVEGFDPARDVIETSTSGDVPLTSLAKYKSVIWSAYSDVSTSSVADLPLLYQFIQFRSKDPNKNAAATGKVQPNLLALTMAAGGHIMLTGQQPVQNVENRVLRGLIRHPIIWLYELEGKQTGTPEVDNPVGDLSFAYKELCLETLDLAYLDASRRRPASGSGATAFTCPVVAWRRDTGNTLRDDTMREGAPIDPNFPVIQLRPEITSPGKFYQPSAQGIDAEVYNPAYFRAGAACQYVPRDTRPCFQPIYGLVCNDVAEPTYMQPVAFWTSAFADRVADVPGAVGARSVVFGFPPVMFTPAQIKPAFEYIVFQEWKLPRKSTAVVSGTQ